MTSDDTGNYSDLRFPPVRSLKTSLKLGELVKQTSPQCFRGVAGQAQRVSVSVCACVLAPVEHDPPSRSF